MPEKPTNDNQQTQTVKKPKSDKLVKSIFAITAILIVAYMIGSQYITPSIPGWQSDFDEALKMAADSNSRLVAVMLDSPQNTEYRRLHKIILKPGNKEAFEKGNFVGVQVRGSDDGSIAKKYDVNSFPTTLLIGSDGTLITKWTGYIGEVDFRSKFLAGQDQNGP